MSPTTPTEESIPLPSRTPSPFGGPDAGLKAISHYERRLPPWRLRLRQALIPIVRKETPYLARVQQACRSPLLDTYFALTANLGTHTFFMTALPICFWCGYPDMGMALVHMLAMGVYFSGFVKDMVCLPRPLSPPLQRITMSGSAALEYGFPSTHTTNAVSVALYCLDRLHNARDGYDALTYKLLCAGCLWYLFSISLGRMYCGMHGFFDVVFGAVLGAVIAWIRIIYGAPFDEWIITGDWTRTALAVCALAVAVRIHPEPADNCPCFDDSVAFVGVVMGSAIGIWQFAQVTPYRETALWELYTFTNNTLLKAVTRIVAGIVVIFLWRAIMKPASLRVLPPIFRFIDHYGLAIPRRYFLQSRDYHTVPPLRRDDNVIPPASDISAFMTNFRHTRKRTVSIGPQSEADAREYIANREQRRRDSREDQHQRNTLTPKTAAKSTGTALPSFAIEDLIDEHSATATTSRTGLTSLPPASPPHLGDSPPSRNPHQHSSTPYLHVEGQATADPNLLTPPASDAGASSSDSGREDEQREDREMFSQLEKPRIRYDVEVVTKLVVYAGIAWWAVVGNPLWFEKAGLV
ncbi:hypothetical protein B0A50_00593 [Salinomyces thailandicus]|uniref:Phosphatidic acid phosphatase type 2/haloperoxidase domain-containing protein n=1 Tax=Salinomyces thailandicus TaxID=706561 RepID=A0A4U0UEQ2_9PEZI|nr:hypothetical protein B0A50_00593 [Salinomyces thailandica]